MANKQRKYLTHVLVYIIIVPLIVIAFVCFIMGGIALFKLVF